MRAIQTLRKERLAGAVVTTAPAVVAWGDGGIVVIREHVFKVKRGERNGGGSTGRDASSDPNKLEPQVGTSVTWWRLRMSQCLACMQ